MMLYLHDMISETTVLGPGKRFAVWFQGCARHCAGCINPDGQPLDRNGFYISADALLSKIMEVPELTGITVSGGEPLLQFDGLYEFVNAVKERTALDIMLYTGFRMEEISGIAGSRTEDFLRKIDILVDGEYIEEENHNEMLRGSSNQKFYFFTPKYRPFAEKLAAAHNRSIEWHGRKDEAFFMVGIPPKGFQETLRQELIQFEERNDKIE